jgi:hypothetical protein
VRLCGAATTVGVAAGEVGVRLVNGTSSLGALEATGGNGSLAATDTEAVGKRGAAAALAPSELGAAALSNEVDAAAGET